MKLITNRNLILVALLLQVATLYVVTRPQEKLELGCRGVFESPNFIRCYEQ